MRERLAIFEHSYHPRINRHTEDVTILQVGESERDFNHPPGGVHHLLAEWEKECEDVAEAHLFCGRVRGM